MPAAITGDPRLRLDVAPQEVTRDAQGMAARVGMQMTNTTGKLLDLFSNPSGPSVVVVKDGVVVATPLAQRMPGHHWKFEPGQTLTVQVAMGVRQCERGAAGPGATQLEPGTYQLYALKTFSPSGGPYLPELVVAGGPWTVQLK